MLTGQGFALRSQTKTLRRLLPYARHMSTRACAAPVPERGVLEVSGKDAQKFLKGMTSKDVEQLGGGYSGVLNATVSMSTLSVTGGPC
jgi:folate-binding Fe-S cluster repair protein YgfZ